MSLRIRMVAPSLSLVIVSSTAWAGTNTTILPMNFKFTHRLGGLVPARQILLEVWEQDSASADDFIGNTTTGNNGQAVVITNEDDGLFDNTLELYAFVSTKAPGFAHVNARALGSTPYFWRNPTGTATYDVTINTTGPAVDLVHATNNTFGEAAMGILMPIVYTKQYFGTTFGVAPAEIEVLYDSTDAVPGTTSTGNFFARAGAPFNARGVPFINIDKNDWASWDVIGHEYSHYIANTQGLDPLVGGPHTIGVDNIPNAATAAQKLSAVGLAWNEGIATFMYQMGVREGNINASFAGLLGSRDFDTWYTDFNAPGTTAADAQVTFEYDVESIAYHTRNMAGVLGQHLSTAQSRGEGEGDELSVQRVLWDIYDPTGEAFVEPPVGPPPPLGSPTEFQGFRRPGRSDKANFGASAAWQQALKGPDNLPNSANGNKSFMESWDDITAHLGTAAGKAAVGLAAGDSKNQAVTRLGEILEEHVVAALPTFGTTDITNPVALIAAETNDTTPRLTWSEQANGRTDIYRLLVFKSDWSIQWDSGNLFDNTADTATNFFWDIPAASALANGFYFWAVLTNPDLRQAADLRDNLVAGIPNQADLFKYYWSGANAFRIVPTPGGVALFMVLTFTLNRRRRAA